jgi:hypothetical protein
LGEVIGIFGGLMSRWIFMYTFIYFYSKIIKYIRRETWYNNKSGENAENGLFVYFKGKIGHTFASRLKVVSLQNWILCQVYGLHPRVDTFTILMLAIQNIMGHLFTVSLLRFFNQHTLTAEGPSRLSHVLLYIYSDCDCSMDTVL